MTKNNQTIAIFILIPMLIFTFAVTVKSESILILDESKKIIYEYFEYINQKDINALSKLFTNKENIKNIEKEIDDIEQFSLISIAEEDNKSIKKAYLKNDQNLDENNTKIYKVKYKIVYKSNSKLKDKSGIYESWYFLTRKSTSSKWLIDVFEK